MPSSTVSPAVLAAHWVLGVAGVYAVAGAVIAVAFVLFGVKRALGGAGRVSAGARLLFLPAAAALWPLVLGRWLKRPA